MFGFDSTNKQLIINTIDDPKFNSLNTTGDINVGGYVTASPKFEIPKWDPAVGINQGEKFINSISGLDGNRNFLVTQGQLYDAISNLNDVDRYITNVEVSGNIVTIEQNNAKNFKFEIPTNSGGTTIVAGVEFKEDLDDDGNNGNWTATVKNPDGSDGPVFTNTTLDKVNSKAINSTEYGQDFVISDTAKDINGEYAKNTITIENIAKADKLQEVSETVYDDHAGRITKLEKGFTLTVGNEEPVGSDWVKAEDGVILEGLSENITLVKSNPGNGKHIVSFDINKNLELETLKIHVPESEGSDPSTEIMLDNQGISVDGNYFLTPSGINANNKEIINVATVPDFSEQNKHMALNVEAFLPTYKKVDQGFNVAADPNKGSWNWKNPGDTISIVGGNTSSIDSKYNLGERKNIETSIDEGKLSISLIARPKVDGLEVGVRDDAIIQINPQGNGHIEGITNTDWGLGTSYTPQLEQTGRSWAATELQLKKLETLLIENGTRYAGDDYIAGASSEKDPTVNPTVVHRRLDEVLYIKGAGEADENFETAEGNIRVSRLENNQGFSIGLSQDLKLTQNGSVLFGNTELNEDSLTFKEGDSSSAGQTTEFNELGLKVSGKLTTSDDLEFTTSRINANKEVIQGVASAVKAKTENGKLIQEIWDTTDKGANANFAANLGDVKALRTIITSNKEAPIESADENSLKYTTGNIQLALKPADVDGHLMYDIKLNDILKLGGTDSTYAVVIDGSISSGSTIFVNEGGNGYITGLQNKDTNVSGFATLGRAATEEQLKQLIDKTSQTLTDKGLFFEGDKGGKFNKDLGETVKIYGRAQGTATTADNILVTNKGNELHIQLAEQLQLGSTGQILFNDTHKLSPDGLILGSASYLPTGFELNLGGSNKISITENEILMGGKQVQKVASGRLGGTLWNNKDHPEFDNAANIGDLEQLRTDVTNGYTVVTVNGGTSAGVDDYSDDIGKLLLKKGTGDDQNEYDIKLSDNIKLGKKDESKDGKTIEGINGSIEIAGRKSKGVKIHADDGKGHLVIYGETDDVSADLTVNSTNPSYTRLQYNNDKLLATLDDGLKFAANFGNSVSLKLNEEIKIIGNLAKEVEEGDLVDGNLGVVSETVNKDGKEYSQLVIKMNKDVSLPDGSLTIGNSEKDPNPIRIQKEKRDENDVSNGGTSFGGEQIHNVASGRTGELWYTDNARKQLDPIKNNVANIGDLEQLKSDVAVSHRFYADPPKQSTLADSANKQYVELANDGDMHIVGDGTYITTSLTDDGKGIKVNFDENKLGEYLKGENGIHYFSVKSENNLVNYDNLGAEAENSMAIGANAQVKEIAVEGVAIGFGSVSDRAAYKGTDQKGYVIAGFTKEPDPDKFKSPTWVSTAGAFSVGYAGDGTEGSVITRQITNVAAGLQDTDAVNVAQLKLLKDYVDDKVINVAGIGGMNFAADSGDPIPKNANEEIKIAGSTNITTTTSEPTGQVTIKLKDDIEVKTVKVSETVKVGDNVTINNNGFTIGATGPTQIQITENYIDMGGNQIHGVEDGKAPTDAVNVRQLNQVGGQILNKINDVDKRAKAGIAQAIATAGLPQAYLPGKNLMAASAGTFGGQTAFAVGISSISDDGKWIIKGTFSGNTQSKFGGSVGVGYQW